MFGDNTRVICENHYHSRDSYRTFIQNCAKKNSVYPKIAKQNNQNSYRNDCGRKEMSDISAAYDTALKI